MEKPTEQEIRKVFSFLEELNAFIGITFSSIGNIEVDVDTIVDIANSSLENVELAKICAYLDTTPEVYKEWVSCVSYNDVVFIKCNALTTRGKQCQNCALQVDGIDQWLKNKDRELYCHLHSVVTPHLIPSHLDGDSRE